jgi:hypothetical protein
VFTRLGGTSQGPFASLNVGQLVGDDVQAVRMNHRRIFTSLGIPANQVVTARQVHGANVAIVGTGQRGTIVPSTDALLTQSHDFYLLMRFADCLPLMLYDPVRSAIALVHCGWRGLLAGVIRNAIQALQRTLGTRPADVFAALGPAIGPCCYEVGPDLAQRVCQEFERSDDLLRPQADGRLFFDLPGAVRAQLLLLGVNQIEDSALCTACRTDEFFSYRAEAGRTGRFAALIGLLGAATASGTH